MAESPSVCQSAEATKRSEKHEAKPKQACLISVVCRLAKCQLNEVNMKIENHSPLEGESNEQGFSEVRLVGGLKIMKNLELRIKNLPSAELQRN